MPCTCSTPATAEALANRRARAVMCHACQHGQSLVQCSLSGKPLLEHANGCDCPQGKMPDKDGNVRWVGLTWIGVPMPVRQYVAGQSPTGRATIDLPGCGCLQSLRKIFPKSMTGFFRWGSAAILVPLLSHWLERSSLDSEIVGP